MLRAPPLLRMLVGNSVARVAVLVVVLLLTAVIGLVQRRRAGRSRLITKGDTLTAVELAAPLGERATFVQFSSPACSPCRAVHRILDDVAADSRELQHVDVDASQRLDLARRFGILRTPTVLVLDSGGVVVSRISGLLTAEQARAAVLDSIRS